jgi:hypothetical protein
MKPGFVPDSGLFGPRAGRVIARSAQGAHYEHEGRDVDWTKVRDPIVLEGPAVLVGQRHPEAHHRGDHIPYLNTATPASSSGKNMSRSARAKSRSAAVREDRYVRNAAGEIGSRRAIRVIASLCRCMSLKA